jgi:hypothetical protein
MSRRTVAYPPVLLSYLQSARGEVHSSPSASNRVSEVEPQDQLRSSQGTSAFTHHQAYPKCQSM